MDGVRPHNTPQPQPLFPLVRLNLIVPFVEELERRQLNADAVLAANGLVRQTVLDPDVFVPVIVVHRFLEEAAREANDPYFGVAVGEAMDIASWPPFVSAVLRATTLMEFLVHLIQAVKGEASSARHSLEVGAEHVFYREIRTTLHEIAPAQNDAFMAAITLRLLSQAAGPAWNAGEVLLKVCDPEVIPSGYLGIHIVGGDRMGMEVRFPATWLLQPMNQRALMGDSLNLDNLARTPTEFIESLRQALALHLDKHDLNVNFVACLAGMSRQGLQRRLNANGTTLSAEVIALKKRRAEQELASSNKPVAAIALALGYTDSTAFTRAFKSWTGQSPREYRQSNRAR